MDEIKKEAIYYWQDKLAKFWPTVKGPSTVEIAMFEAGYKLATEGTHSCYDECTNPGCSLRRENARLREALEFCLSAAESMYDKPVTEGLDPTFYHSLSYEGDLELKEKTKQARSALEGKE